MDYKVYRLKGDEDLFIAFSLGHGYVLKPYGIQGFIYYFQEIDFEIAIKKLQLKKEMFE